MGNRTMRNSISIYRKLTRLGAWLASGLLVGQCVLVLVSWLQTAAMPETFPRTLLNAEGIRWFFGRFTENLMQPMLVWLLLLCISLGALYRSGLLHFNGREYRQRVAMRVVFFEFLLFVFVMVCLTMVPHAILLNVMGGIWGSSFTKSLLPYICFAVMVMSLTFGVASNRFRSLAEAYEASYSGIRVFAPLYLLYVLSVQLYSSLVYLYF